jgi:hypothetical protein
MSPKRKDLEAVQKERVRIDHNLPSTSEIDPVYADFLGRKAPWRQRRQSRRPGHPGPNERYSWASIKTQ